MALGVLIADNHAMVRQTLRQRLSREPDMAPWAITADWQALKNALNARHVDVIVWDAAMNESIGEVGPCLKLERRQGIKVIVMSIHTDRRYVEASFRLGAVGYLVKSSAYEELAGAVRCVSLGSRYIGSDIPGSGECRPFGGI
jgi:DNA-binding NarL/FixJ family response regulator